MSSLVAKPAVGIMDLATNFSAGKYLLLMIPDKEVTLFLRGAEYNYRV